MKVHRFVISFVLCCTFLATAREYSGIVVDKATKNPLENVLVSVGHSEYYTRTDKDGRFSFTDPTPEGEPPTAISKVKLQNARWNFQGRTLDLRTVPGVNSVSIYTTNGKRVFSGQVPSSRIVSLPSMSMGIYILELHGEHGVIDRGSTKLSKDAVETERLIFRHDDYLPKDIDMAGSNTDMRVELKQDERSVVFDKSKVHEYRFTIAANVLNDLNTNGSDEKFREAELKFDDDSRAISGKIGIRYKGSSYTLPRCFCNRQKTCPKISYKLKFTQYDKDKRLYGLKKVNLHAFAADDIKDSTKMHEMLAYELFRDMGIPAPRTSYANVYINDQLIGLFVTVEEIDGRFTKSRWPEYGDGNLYKEKWPKSGNERDYINGLKTNNDPGDNPSAKKMVEYYNAINSANEQNFEKNVSPYMDLDYFLRYLVVDVAIKNWDGIRALYGGTSHNYFFYEEEKEVSNGKIWIIPWDMDQALKPKDRYFEAGGGMGGTPPSTCSNGGGFPGGGFPGGGGGGGGPLPQWNVATTNCGNQTVDGQSLRPPNCEKLFKITAATSWKRYVQLGDLFLKDLFVSQRLNEKIDRYSDLIKTSVQNDPNIDYNAWTSEINHMKNYLNDNINQFRSYLHQ